MRFIFCILLTLIGITAQSQVIFNIPADSVKIFKRDGSPAELIIENGTRNIKGFLYNKGNGRTEFKKGLIKINDTTFLIGEDTLIVKLFDSTSLSNRINEKLNIVDTTDKWVNRILRRSDSVFLVKGNTEQFVFIDSTGGNVTSVFGRTGAITAQETDYNSFYPLLSGSYNNPSWINQLAWSKITGAPSFLTSESDPFYLASSWFSTTNNSSNWNAAYGWGNHASAGYVPMTRQITINGVTYNLNADRTWTISGVNLYNTSDSLTGNRFVNLGTNKTLSFGKGSNTYWHFFNNGNVWIGSGTPVDAGYKVDIQGSIRYVGSIFSWQNGSGGSYFEISSNNSEIQFGALNGTRTTDIPIRFYSTFRIGANSNINSFWDNTGSFSGAKFTAVDNLTASVPAKVEMIMTAAGGQILAYKTGVADYPLYLSPWSKQVAIGINTGMQASAALQVDATDKGFLPPRLTTSQGNSIGSKATGLQWYDTDRKHPVFYDGSNVSYLSKITIGTAAPSITPTSVGQIFVDTTNKKAYVSTGTSSSTDWTILN